MVGEAKHPRGGAAPPLRYTVTPGIATKIVLKTLPGGVCILHGEDEPDPQRKLKFYADQEGMIQFHVRPAKESDILVCNAYCNPKPVQKPLPLIRAENKFVTNVIITCVDTQRERL